MSRRLISRFFFFFDGNLSFQKHFQLVAQNPQLLLGLLQQKRVLFPLFVLKKKLVEATFLPVHHHCVLCRNVSAPNLHMLDSVYHRAPGFITKCGFLTHRSVLYAASQKCTPACASVLLLASQRMIPV